MVRGRPKKVLGLNSARLYRLTGLLDSASPLAQPRSTRRVTVHPSTTVGGRYRAFGLTIRSDIELPELAPADPAGAEADDVHILRGAIGAAPDGARRLDVALRVNETDVWLETEAGRYWASRGGTIIVDAALGASARDTRLYLLGTMMGAILHQRGVLPLHANAIVLDDHAIALAGPSGAGKSTLAAYFQDRGRTVLSDDVCAVTFDTDGQAWAWPGLARIKLWGDTLTATGRERADLDRIADDMDKFSLPVDRVADARAPLKRLYILDPDGAPAATCARLTGAEAVNAVLSNIYRWPLATAMGRASHQFDQAVTLVRACEIVSLRYPRGFDALPAVVRRLDTGRLDAVP